LPTHPGLRSSLAKRTRFCNESTHPVTILDMSREFSQPRSPFLALSSELTLFIAESYKLFGTEKKVKSSRISKLQTLVAKHRGGVSTNSKTLGGSS
jgi:hypothetical protein